MGVPKFYRWISERYPCLSQVIQEHQIPEFDNLYLDMNGIIHQCSHPNDDDPHFRITEEKIFVDIFHYIEVLFRIIKPKKVFFMAVDGVAPRAKMNQQRGRRFRSAKEAEDNIRKALQKGQTLPKEERFDSNCITPGTSFMVKLHEQLKYFVNDKVSNDPAWQGLRIYLSGHETPGEGEHKIMDFMRSEKTRPDHDPNTRHCLYGLDADLMMLGLSTHEPHFSLLREEVKFGKSAKRISKPEKVTFHLLHLSLFREYIDWEFSALKETLSFPYELTRIVDDWILMGFLVGNDFIPHLPQLHINHDALPYLYRIYIEVMPSLDGYLNYDGKLNLPRFERYMEAVSKFDTDKFSEEFVDMKWFEKKLTHKPPHRRVPPGERAARLKKDDAEDGFAALASCEDVSDMTISPELQRLSAKLDDDEEENGDTFEIEFKMHKRNYYQEKMGFVAVDSEMLVELSYQYVLGIQWILFYYFTGVPSWSWFFPFHYAPYMSDIKGFSEKDLKFDMGKPFKPFEQLLGVLPAASKQLLPAPFQSLMIMEDSAIIEYYPLNFKTDLNGKQQDWEAVVLIPFIDEKRLLEAMAPLYSRLSKSELARNVHSSCFLYDYESTLSFNYVSSLPESFPDISCCHTRCKEIPRDEFLVDPEQLKRGLCDGVRLDVYFPGFPTLYHIPHTAKLDRVSVKVFSFHSKGESMVLEIPPQPGKHPAKDTEITKFRKVEEIFEKSRVVVSREEAIRVAEELLGESCYVGWPHMVEALVYSVSDETYRYTLDKSKPSQENGEKPMDQVFLPEREHKERRKQISSITECQLERSGIRIGDTKILIEACPIKGKRFVCGPKGRVDLRKEWSSLPIPYPLQLTLKDIHVHEGEASKIETIEELFPVGSRCFMLASPHYGACGEILEVDTSQGRVRVQLKIPAEPDMQSVIDQLETLSLNYLPSHIVAKKLGITANLLARITSKFLIEPGSSEKTDGGYKVDIGLNLKNNKQNKEVLGFARRTDLGWTFSPTAHRTVAEYLKRFPRVFEALAKSSSTDRYFEADIASGDNGSSTLSEIQDWLKTLPASKMEAVSCGAETLDEPVVKAIEEAVQAVKNSSQPKNVKVRVRPYVLFRPSTHLGNISPDKDADFQLFDRVVNVTVNTPIPFGLLGTIIGIHRDAEESEMLEVAFDDEFLGGQPLRCSSNKVHLMRPSSLINISFGEREEDRKKGRIPPARKPIQSAWGSPRNGRGPYSPYSPDLGASPDLSRNLRTTPQGSPNVRIESQGSPGFGSPSKTGSPHQRGWCGPANNPVTTPPSQFSRSPNSAFTRPQDSTPGDQSRYSPQSSGGASRGSDRRQERSQRFQKQSKPANSSEFANMWKDLKKKEMGPTEAREAAKPKTILQKNEKEKPDQNHDTSTANADNNAALPKTTEESAKALCELLHIGEKSENIPVSGHTKQNQTPGRKLTVDELFNSQEPAHQKPSPTQPLPNAPEVFPSHILTNWCLSRGFPPPSFYYTQTFQGVSAIVDLGLGMKVVGALCQTRPDAIESASSIALCKLQPALLQAAQISRGRGRSAGLFSSPFPVGPLPGGQVLVAPRFHPRLQSPQQFVSGHRPIQTQRSSAVEQSARDGLNRSASPAKSQQNLGLRAAASPFVPLQVTRRNAPPKKQASSKPELPTPEKENDKTTDIAKENPATLETTDNKTEVNTTQAQSTETASSDKLHPTVPQSAKKHPVKKVLLAPSFFNQ